MATSRKSTLARIMRHELRVMIADRTLPAIAVLFSILLLYGFFTGLHETRRREEVVKALVAGQAKTNADNIAQWHRVMARQQRPAPFANPVDPSSIGGKMGAQYAILPTLALSPVAAGQSDMLADYYRVTIQSRTAFLEESEVESPWKLLSGQFDLAFVLIYMFPLFIFAISFNMLSVERDQGTLRMLLSQPLTLPLLVLAKIVVRAGVILGLAVLVPALAVIATRQALLDGAALGTLALWMALVIAYGLFWFALSALVASLGRASATNALLLIGTWVLLVLVVPVAMNLAVSRAHPAPSRTDLATQTRLVTIDGLNRYKHLWSTDYDYVDRPETLLPKDGRLEVASRLRAFYLMDAFVDQQLTDVLSRFDRQLGAQQALVDRFGFISPAIVANEGMASLAGNGTRRYERFKQQVIAYHESWKSYFVPRVLDGIAIVETDFERFPRWSWQEENAATVRADAWFKIAQLLAVAAVMGLLASWRFGRRQSV
ncbi:ABC transporter permease subunit [Pendulispora albinea]|uniref:ABC transporter permease subunit n=1 Tax=Pendulispora albinea TaxID=2741071 RepID=A0ABZ2M7V8_9BACT